MLGDDPTDDRIADRGAHADSGHGDADRCSACDEERPRQDGHHRDGAAKVAQDCQARDRAEKECRAVRRPTESEQADRDGNHANGNKPPRIDPVREQAVERRCDDEAPHHDRGVRGDQRPAPAERIVQRYDEETGRIVRKAEYAGDECQHHAGQRVPSLA
jgi:hypothetical protein